MAIADLKTSLYGDLKTSSYRVNQYLDVCEINGSKFAIFSTKIESDNTSIRIDLSDYNIIFLAPLEAENNIFVKAISVFVLNSINSKGGNIEINAIENFFTRNLSCHLDLIVRSNKFYMRNISEERLELITGLFKDGISKNHGPTIVNAIVEMFDAIKDPSAENQHSDRAKALEFFNIPIEKK